MASPTDPLLERLTFLYGPTAGPAAYTRLRTLLDDFRAAHPGLAEGARLSERDVILITYGDSLREPNCRPLQTLHRFLKERAAGAISTVHILPFFPYSSDDGFSVIDYRAVNPDLGTWDDVDHLGADFKLMFDLVVNHVSQESEWFQKFLGGDPAYRDFFITVDPATDLSAVVRPRTLPLLSAFETARGTQHVWTTFSSDQIDLNFAHPEVLLRMIDVLLFYVGHGADLIRLDAIAYLWKEVGTGCIHLPQTHAVVQLFRAVLDEVAPGVALITETNVPHVENVSYFGDGGNEAQLVYQFTLPPLLLHTFATEDAAAFNDWAAGLEGVSARTSFFNFTASHDGIGVRPVEQILAPAQVEALIERAQRHGGDVSYKQNADGSRSPYELNINYFDALSDPAADESLEVQVRRFLASQAIQLAFVGVPGIYIHSLLGSRNWREGVAQTGRLRSINRQKLDAREVEEALDDPSSLRGRVFHTYRRLIARRVAQAAFHPHGAQEVLRLHPCVVALLRTSPDGAERILALTNVANRSAWVDLRQTPLASASALHDVITGESVSAEIELPPYGVLWIKGKSSQ